MNMRAFKKDINMKIGLKKPILIYFAVLIFVSFFLPSYYVYTSERIDYIFLIIPFFAFLIFLYAGFLFRKTITDLHEERMSGEKAASEELRQAAEMLTVAQKIAKIGYWEEYLVSGEINFSEELMQILDLDIIKDNHEKKDQLNRLHWNENDTFRSKKEELYNYGQIEWEYKIITRLGNAKYLFEQISLEKKDYAPNKLIGVVQDISERKLSEQKIVQSQQYYKSLFDGAKDAIILFYPKDEIVIDVNQQACEMYGFTKEEFVGKSLISISKYPEKGKDRIKNTLQKKNCYHFSSTQYKKDGSEIYLDITASVIDYFDEEVILSINRDITEPRLVQERIRILSLGIEQNPSPIVITNINAEIEYVNRAFEKVTGYTFEEVIGKNPRILQSGETPKELYKDLWNTLLEGKEWKGEFKNKKKDGSYFWEMAVIYPVIDSNNQVKQYLASKLDITERKKLEYQLKSYHERLEFLVDERTRRLRESEEAFRALSESSMDVIMRFNENLEHIYVNPAAEKLFEKQASEFLGKKYSSFDFNAGLVSSWENAIKKVFETKEEFQIELLIQEDRWFDCRLYPEYDNDGKVVSVITSSRDISSMKKNEKNLQKEERLLRGVAEASNKLLSLDSFFKRMNMALEIIGKAMEVDRAYIFENSRDPKTKELLMNQLYEWSSPDVSSQIENRDLQKLSYKKAGVEQALKYLPYGKPYTILVKDIPAAKRKIFTNQQIKSILTMPVEIGGVFWGFVGFDECKYDRIWDESEIAILKILASDIGGAFTRKLIEDALMNTEERFKALFDFAPSAYFIIDLEGFFIDVNNSLEKTLGYTKKEIAEKKKIQSFIRTKEDRDALAKVLQNGRNGIPSEAVELNLTNKAGKILMLELNTFPVTLAEKNMILCAVHDISLSKEKEKEVRTALTHSQELNEIKSRFVSMVSHEFRTPLSTILSSVEILRLFESRLKDEEKMNHYKKITKSIDYLTNLLDDVITINRADSGRLNVKFKMVDLISLLDQWIQDIKASFAETPTIIFDNNQKELKAELDESLFRQIVSNLLNNAIKYTPSSKKIVISVSEKEGSFILEIADEGIGIPADVQQEVFNPFYRAMNTGNVPGSGLGLAVAKRSVESLNGKILFVSKENKGTTFIVIIPLRRGKSEKNITN